MLPSILLNEIMGKLTVKKKKIGGDRQPGAMPGDPGDTTTLNHVLFMFGIMENKIIADVMNIHGSFLCYEYIEPKVQ